MSSSGHGPFLQLCLLCASMFLGSMLAGLIPMSFKLSDRMLHLVTTFGIGMLMGTAFIVIIPEGIHTVYSEIGHAGHAHAHGGHDDDAHELGGNGADVHALDDEECPDAPLAAKYVGHALVLGFALMMLLERVVGHAGHSHGGGGGGGGHGHGHGHSHAGGGAVDRKKKGGKGGERKHADEETGFLIPMDTLSSSSSSSSSSSPSSSSASLSASSSSSSSPSSSSSAGSSACSDAKGIGLGDSLISDSDSSPHGALPSHTHSHPHDGNNNNSTGGGGGGVSSPPDGVLLDLEADMHRRGGGGGAGSHRHCDGHPATASPLSSSSSSSSSSSFPPPSSSSSLSSSSLSPSPFSHAADDGYDYYDEELDHGHPRKGTGMAVVGVLVHCAVDGLALGAISASGDDTLELIVFIAIMLHKAPAAFGLTSFLLQQRQSIGQIRKSLLVFSAAAPIAALLCYSLLLFMQAKVDTPTMGLALLFSAGTVLFTIAAHILPMLEQREGEPHDWVKTAALCFGVVIPLFITLEHSH